MLNTHTKKSTITKKLILSVLIILVLLLLSNNFLIRRSLNLISTTSNQHELQAIAVTAREAVLSDTRGDFTYDEKDNTFKSGDHVINDDFSIIEHIKKQTGCTVGFFYQDFWAYTTFTSPDGQSMHGKKPDNPGCWKTVSKGKDVYIPNQKINGISNEIFCTPLRQPSDDSIFGMVMVIKPVNEINKIKNQAQLCSTLASVLLIILGLGILIIIFSKITKSIKNVCSQVNEIVSDIQNDTGDLSKRIVCNSNDEIGLLAQAVNGLLNELQKVMINVKNGSSTLADSISETVQNISTSSQDAINVSATMEELSANMEEVATSIETFMLGNKNMTDSLQKMAEEAERGNSFTDDIRTRATSVHETATAAYNEVQETSTSIKNALQTAITESHNVEKINELTEEILNISAQTNLLALNASIEAARAGEFGKGFAVVAEEIRELADNSRETANNIQQVSEMVVTAVNQLASSSNEMLQFVSDKILSDYDMFKQTIEQYNNDAISMNNIIREFVRNTTLIDGTAKQMNTNITEISQSAEQSANGIENIVGNINNLANAMVHIQGNADEVSKVVNSMSRYILRFKQV